MCVCVCVCVCVYIFLYCVAIASLHMSVLVLLRPHATPLFSYIWVLHDVLGFAYIVFIASVFANMDIPPWVCVCVSVCNMCVSLYMCCMYV